MMIAIYYNFSLPLSVSNKARASRRSRAYDYVHSHSFETKDTTLLLYHNNF